MQVGEEYRVYSDSALRTEKNVRVRIQGKVIYVHPAGRYATLEFQGVHGRFRECYYPEQLTERNRVGEEKGKEDQKRMLKPILFNTEMVRAILDGRKTVTRRIIKPQPRGHAALVNRNLLPETTEVGAGAVYAFEDGTAVAEPFKVGDVLYVRETWSNTADLPGISEEDVVYAADFTDKELAHLKDRHFRWRPSIHMPKELARLFLKVTAVRAERLCSITIRDAYAEGVRNTVKFPELWDSTIPKTDLDTYGWRANPWVWVIQFEVCEKPEA